MENRQTLFLKYGLSPLISAEFATLMALVDAEKKLMGQSKSPSPIPFHHVLLKLSPRYATTFRIGDLLGLQVVPAFKSHMQLLREFQPFCRTIEYADLKNEIHFLFSHTEYKTVVAIRDTLRVFNWSLMHEYWHLIFYLLVPCRQPEFLTHYFVFFEAMVTLQEAVMARDLGLQLQNALESVRAVFHAPEHPKARRDSTPAEYAALAQEYYFDRLVRDPTTQGWKFKHWVPQYWTGHQKFQGYPTHLMSRTFEPFKKFHMPSWDPVEIEKHPEWLLDFGSWLVALLKQVEIR